MNNLFFTDHYETGLQYPRSEIAGPNMTVYVKFACPTLPRLRLIAEEPAKIGCFTRRRSDLQL